MSQETCDHDVINTMTIEVPTTLASANVSVPAPSFPISALPSSDIDPLSVPPLCTDGAATSTINIIPSIAILSAAIGDSINTPVTPAAKPAIALNIALDKVIENFEVTSTTTDETNNVQDTEETNTVQDTEETNNVQDTEETNNVQDTEETNNAQDTEETNNIQDTELGLSEIEESDDTPPVTTKPKGSMFEMFSRNNKLKSSIKKKKKYDINGEFINTELDKKGLQVQWNRSNSCLKKREIAIKLKIKVPHFKRMVLGKNASNRSLISILSPQPPMWSSLPSLKYPQKDSNQENTQHESPTKEDSSTKEEEEDLSLKASTTLKKTHSRRPKLAFSRPGSAVPNFYPLPWKPGSAKMSPWKPEIKIPMIKSDSVDNEDIVKKILSVLPPLESLVSQYESSDVFLHRILKAYQIRCKEIDNDHRLRESIKAKSENDISPKGINITENKKEPLDNQILLDTIIESSESSNAHTPNRPSPTLPSNSSRSPKTQSLSNAHESSPSPSIVHQNTPIISIVESILDNKVRTISPRQSKLKNNGCINKKIIKVLSPTKASTASRYQRQFFCADN